MEDKKKQFAEKLQELIDAYETTRTSYRDFINRGDNNKHTLLEFQSRFIDLKASLRPYHTYFTNEWTRRDDKSATSIKFRICVAISEGRYEDKEDPTVYEKCSITSAEKYASGTMRYKKFIDERGFYRESLTNINDLREDLSFYVNEIKDRLKYNFENK